MKHLNFIIRTLRSNSKLNAVNLFSMALGLAVTGIILSYVYQEFHFDSGNPDSGKIYRVIQKEGDDEEPYTFAPLAQTLKADMPGIKEAVRVCFFYGYLACSSGENKFNETSAIFADPGFFELFPFPLVRGNSKECLLAPNSIVLSGTAARKYFGKEDPIGKHLIIAKDQDFTVTGVFDDFKTNSNFRGDLVLPLKTVSKLTQIWIAPGWEDVSDIHTFVLLADKTNSHELSERARDFISKYIPKTKIELRFQPMKDIHVDKQIFWESAAQANVMYLYILVIVAFVVLGISSANFLFLFVGIKSQRKVNTGVKKVCGASRLVLFFEYFREVLVLMVLSVLFAVILYEIYKVIITNYFPFLPRIIFFDFKLWTILLAVVIVVTLLTGFYPSYVLSSQRPAHIFSSQKGSIPGKVKFVNKLVVVQFSLCIALIVATTLMYKQVNFMESLDTGYARDELITIPLNMHAGDGIYNEKFDAFVNELKKYPEIKNVTMAFSSPSSVNTSEDAPDWEGKPEGKEVNMHWESVFYDYFNTLGVKIILGRGFNRDFPGDAINWDNHTGAFVLNKSAVRAMGIEDPVGKEFKVWGFKGPIIGVVDDYNFQSMRSAISPMFFTSNPFLQNEIIVRTTNHATTALSDIKAVWNRFVPGYPLEFHFVSDQVKALYRQEQNLAGSLNLFSILAILIACMGLFTLTVLSMDQRTKEIGIRKVNGARISEVMVMLNRDFVKWVLIAFVIAMPIAYYAMHRWLENFAYKTTLSWWIFALAGVLALGIALLTVSWQSWKAAARNPVEALRYE